LSVALQCLRLASIKRVGVQPLLKPLSKVIRQRGSEWRGPCPIHQGTDDSFAVKPDTGQWYCHSQCGRGGSILDLEMARTEIDFKSARRNVETLIGRSRDVRAKARRVVATYDYTDEANGLLFQCVRYDPKRFSQRRPDGRGEWIANLDGVRRVLYRLPKLASAETILVVEGEQDVHTLEALGYVATCNPMGAGKWRAEYAETLRGKNVIVFADNDAPGEKHAHRILQSLAGIAATVRAVPVPVGKDVSDWVAAGATREAIDEAIERSGNQPTGNAPKRRRIAEALDNESDLQYAGEPYTVRNGRMYVWKSSRDGQRFPLEIANFVARITAENLSDDVSRVRGNLAIYSGTGNFLGSHHRFVRRRQEPTRRPCAAALRQRDGCRQPPSILVEYRKLDRHVGVLRERCPLGCR
jgi:CHC2 zinc finger/Toprim domain